MKYKIPIFLLFMYNNNKIGFTNEKYLVPTENSNVI